jgi:hypothetical protein
LHEKREAHKIAVIEYFDNVCLSEKGAKKPPPDISSG